MTSDGIGPVVGRGNTDVLSDLRRGRIQGEEALRTATRLLEGFTYQELFKALRRTIPEGGAIPGGAGNEIFQDLLDQHIAQLAAMGSERGLGSALYRQFLEAASDSSDADSVEADRPDGPA